MDIPNPSYGHPHAHPSPDAASDRLQLAAVNIDVRLRDQIVKSRASDVLYPELRRSPFDGASPVSHLDVVSCWKGLSHKQACEMIMWERFHHEALSKQISEALRTILLSEMLPLSGNTSFEYRLSDAVSSQMSRYIEVDVDRLIRDMIRLLYTEYGHVETADGQNIPSSTCFAAPRDLPAMVFNFLRTRDCYVQAQSRTYVEFTASCSTTSAIRISCEVNWQPPLVDFSDLQTCLKPGEEYLIKPEYASTNFGLSSFRQFCEEVEFQVASDKLPVNWDPAMRCFRATVPISTRQEVPTKEFLFDLYGDASKPNHARTTLTGKMSLTFPDGVRLERTTRYSLKLEITEPCDPQGSPIFGRLPALVSNDMQGFESVLEAFQFSEGNPETMRTGLWNVPIREKSWVPSWSNTPVSKCGDNKCSQRLATSISDHSSPRSTYARKTTMTTPTSDQFSPTSTYGDKKSEKKQTVPRSERLSKIAERGRSANKSDNTLCSKRKASKSSPSAVFDRGSAFESTRLALDQFEHMDLELPPLNRPKRRKCHDDDQRPDSGIHMILHDNNYDERSTADDKSWADRELDSLGNFTTMYSGKANAHHDSTSDTNGDKSVIWTNKEQEAFERALLMSMEQLAEKPVRAYTASMMRSKYAPRLKKKGNAGLPAITRAKTIAKANAELDAEPDVELDAYAIFGLGRERPSLPQVNPLPSTPNHSDTDSSVHSVEKAFLQQCASLTRSGKVVTQMTATHLNSSFADRGTNKDMTLNVEWSPPSQGEIKKNFEEFVQKAETEITRPTHDQKAFEQNFLADSSDMSWDTEGDVGEGDSGLSELLDGVSIDAC